MPTLSIPPIAQSYFTVTSSIFPGTYFTKFSGLNDESGTTNYADGLDFRLFYLIGLSQLQEMTLEIPHSPELHEDLILYKKNNPCTRFVTVIKPIECEGTEIVSAVNTALYITGCQLTKLNAFTVDRTQNQTAMIALSFVADDYYLG